MDDLSKLSALEITMAYAAQKLSPIEVTKAALARIETINPKINAIYHIEPDTALIAAKESEARWLAGTPKGPLDGLPTTVKDALSATGMPEYRGSAASPKHIATEDHSTVARMREGGMVFLGKNTMCDYGIIAAGVSSQHGVTRNPWDLSKNTGASSSGAAASIAAGIEPVSVGTDIVGSIRLPCSYCGLVGLKPSYGRVPYHFPNSPAITAGPMGRNTDDVAFFMNLLAQPDTRDHSALPYDGTNYLKALDHRKLADKKALLITDIGFGVPVDDEVRGAVTAAAKLLADNGLDVDEIGAPPFPADAAKPAEDFYRIRCLTEFATRPEVEQKKSPVIYKWTRAGLNHRATDLYTAFNGTQQLRAQACALIEGYDYILMPSTPIPAHAAEEATPMDGDLFAPWCNNFLFNLTEQPASSINCGFTQSGLPIGLQIIGQRYDDVGVLQMTKCFEELRGPITDWPQFD